MKTDLTIQRRCAGCGCGLGHATRTLVVTYEGWRYEVCGYTNDCADRLMARLSRGSAITTSATNDTMRVFGAAGMRRWP